MLPAEGRERLVDGPYVRLDWIDGAPSPAVAASYADAPLLVIPREGEAMVAGETVTPSQCALAPHLSDITFAPEGTCLIAQPCGGER
ncbi:hypothetical protein AEB_P0066 [Altererythrobacter sp. B11]|uniref:hypothetical protein n=1 Tax=Altererythrobacter sp. B11 TaxID=2060312 RepID=UPI000DC6EAB7|nr:hypothetical protein [Altererythrobacter sp. B11]BBC70934.1 hypothetical protein AEB_P0066 [Altererythrobacter sp. B11]